jgi:ankyrin repeat protein
MGQLACMNALITAGVDIEAKDAQGGRTPLMKVSENGHTTCVIALIEAGADCEAKVTSRPVVGATSLWLAADSGHPATVRGQAPRSRCRPGAESRMEP